MHDRSALLFSTLITAFVGGILLLLIFETWALFTGNQPITNYVRPGVQAFPEWAFVIAVVVGLVFGHFLWGPAGGPTSPGPSDRALSLWRRS